MSALWGTISGAMEHFGEELRRLRQASGISLRSLADLVAFDYSYLAQVERGARPGSVRLAQKCDEALGTSGRLTAIFRASRRRAGDEAAVPPRRAVLQAMTVLAGGANGSLAALEATRQGLAAALGDVPDAGEWSAIAATYTREFFTVAPAELLPELSADLLVLQRVLGAREGRAAADLARSAAQLGVVQAMTLAGLGQLRAARRWWHTARTAADLSRDTSMRVWVRSWDAVNGLYERRPLPAVLALIDETLAISTRPSAGVAGALAGRAQAYALLGDTERSKVALRKLSAVTERMPDAVVADEQSMHGWPEYRLRHTESYVHSQLGEIEPAYDAQDRASLLYPPELAREHAQVELHRARCLVLEGHLADGLGHALRTLVELPDQFHNQSVYEMGGHVLTAVPAGEYGRSAVLDLRALVNRPTPGTTPVV